MTTATLERETAPTRTTTPRPHRPIPMNRIVGVELSKMFDTRSGFWLMMSIAITGVLATGAVILWAPADDLTYATFAAAVGFPMSVILPMIAILAVTSEWSQRSGLTTFTLVPHRGRVITAKAVAAVSVAVVSMVVALAIGALGNVVGTAISGTELVWDIPVVEAGYIVLGNVLGLMIGFMLGVLIRSSAGAIVAYFVFSLVLPTLFGLLVSTQEWFRDVQPWIDFTSAQSTLFEGVMTRDNWAYLASATGLWVVLPLIVGLVLVLRSEVK